MDLSPLRDLVLNKYLFSAHREHSLDRGDGFFSCLFFYLHLRRFIHQTVIHLFQGVHPHILALVTTATNAFGHLRRNGYKLLIRTCLLHLVKYTALRSNYKALGRRMDGMLEQSLSRTYYVALSQNRSLTLRVSQYFHTRIRSLEL